MQNTLKKPNYLSSRRIATLATLTALSMIMFMVESLFPPLFIPGAKMGISNIFSLLTLILLSPVDALICVLIRTTLGSMFVGSMSTLMYSMTAGVASILVSSLLVEFAYPKVSIVSISVAAAVLHNITQNVVFVLVSKTPQMLGYLPWLAILGVVAGFTVGAAVYFVAKYIPTKIFANLIQFETKNSVLPPQQHKNSEENSPETQTQTKLQQENDTEN